MCHESHHVQVAGQVYFKDFAASLTPDLVVLTCSQELSLIYCWSTCVEGTGQPLKAGLGHADAGNHAPHPCPAATPLTSPCLGQTLEQSSTLACNKGSTSGPGCPASHSMSSANIFARATSAPHGSPPAASNRATCMQQRCCFAAPWSLSAAAQHDANNLRMCVLQSPHNGTLEQHQIKLLQQGCPWVVLDAHVLCAGVARPMEALTSATLGRCRQASFCAGARSFSSAKASTAAVAWASTRAVVVGR